MGSSAFAFENTQVSGDARFFYSTTDGTGDGSKADLFGKNTSTADAGVNLGVTTEIDGTFKAGIKGYAVATMGLEKQIAANSYNFV